MHERVRNRRHNFAHQTARRRVNQYGRIAVKKLAGKKLAGKNMAKSPAPKQDAETGDYLPNGASQKAGLNKSILKERWHLCPMCGTSLDRDINAAINILAIARNQIALG